MFQKATAINGRHEPLATRLGTKSTSNGRTSPNAGVLLYENPSPECPVAKESATAKIGRAFNLRAPFVRFIDLLA